MPKQKLTSAQLEQFRIATNRVSLESLRYAVGICGTTLLATETIAALEKVIEIGSADLRPLMQRATQSTFAHEPLLDAILCALKWASSESAGGFRVGNITDAVYAAKLKSGEPNSDDETYAKLDAIHDQYLGPYFRQLAAEQSAKTSPIA